MRLSPTYFPQAVFTANAIAGPWPTSGGATVSMYSNYPGNFFPASLDAVGFVDLANDNLRLTSSSPFKGKASDGTDVGVNFASLDAALAGASASAPSPPPPTNPIPVPTAAPSSSTDVTPPSVTITYPANGTTVASGPQTVTVNASDNVGVTLVKIFLNGSPRLPGPGSSVFLPGLIERKFGDDQCHGFRCRGNSRTTEVNVSVGWLLAPAPALPTSLRRA